MKKDLFRNVSINALILLTIALFISSCGGGGKAPAEEAGSAIDSSLKKGVILVDYREKQKVDIYMDGDIFTSYIYPSELAKPVLFPVRTSEGTEITRGYPISPKAGERADHKHHMGIWFNHGDVNGYDFWNASITSPSEEDGENVRILHRGVKRAESREALGVLEIAADWQVPLEDGNWHTIVQENTIFEFSGDENTRTIDRITQLTAQEKEVVFTDSKEGMFGIRVARELEHPSDEPRILVDADGNPSEEKTVDNEGIKGEYLSSEGAVGLDAWGKKARWVSLNSNIGEEEISLAIFDHPDNFGYPSYWHARGYGLFAVNNLGAQAYDKSAEPVHFVLAPGESVVFKHRLYLASGFHAGTDQLENVFEAFRVK